MPFTPFEFDDSVGRTEPGRPHVPEGYYLLEGVKLTPTPEDYAKTTGVLPTWRFIEGPSVAPSAGAGREIDSYCALGGKKGADGSGSQFGFGMMLGALGAASVAKKLVGQKIESYSQFAGYISQIEERAFKGKRVVALIATQAGNNGRPFSSIEEYYPESEWPNLKGATLGPLAAPRTANGATTAAPATPAQVAALTNQAMALFEDAA